MARPKREILFRLKPLARKFQRAAVFRGRPYDGNLGFDFQRHLDGGLDQAGSVGDGLVCDPRRIAADPGRVERDAAVEAAWESGWVRAR
jgi:hypothetical protein